MEERLCKAHRKRMCDRILSLEKAIDVAKAELDRRLEGMNEFRTQLDGQAKTFITRAETELMISKLEDRQRDILKRLDTQGGSTKWSDHILVVLIAAAVAIAIRIILQ